MKTVSYLEFITTLDESLRDAGQVIVAEVQYSQILQVPELVRAEHGVEVVPEHVVAEVDLLQRVLHPVKQSLRQPPHGVVGEVHNLERNITGGEDLGGEELPANILLSELLDVVAPGKQREVLEHNIVTVDSGGVDFIERTEAGDVDGGAELHAGNLYRGDLSCCWRGKCQSYH